MIKLGAVTIDTSHPKAFSQYFNSGDRARYVGVYNGGFRGDNEVEGFIKMNPGTKRYYSLEDMSRDVDIALIHACNWDKHLEFARPFIKAGKPVFIDKPIVGSFRDCREIERLAKDGAVILGSSCFRYADIIKNFFAIPVEKRGELLHINSTIGVDEFNYAIHAVELILGYLPGDRAVNVKYIGSATAHGNTVDSYYVSFESGAAANYHIHLNAWQASMSTVITTKTSYTDTVNHGNTYSPLLDAVCDFMEGKPNCLAPVEDITEATKIMLAGKLSKENGGADISPRSLPDNASFDGFTFETKYAAAAAIIYL